MILLLIPLHGQEHSTVSQFSSTEENEELVMKFRLLEDKFQTRKQIMVMEIIVSVVLLFLGIAVLVIIHICIVGRAFRRGFGNGGEHVVQRGTPKGKGMSLEELKKLPCLNYRIAERGSDSASSVDCAVCLETFKVGDKCRLLPNCQHCFHAHCIDLWLIKTPFCPICRACAQLPIIQLDSGEGSSLAGEDLA